jgi:Subtilisin inhibitor-like
MTVWMMLVPIAVVALAACNDGGGDDVTAGTAGSPTATAASTELTITFDPGEGAAVQEWTLICDPSGGTHPRPEAACAALADIDPTVFEPVPPNQACTQIFGGPETATVQGTWDGEPLDASFARNNGCEIARWDAVVDLLGAEPAAASPT